MKGYSVEKDQRIELGGGGGGGGVEDLEGKCRVLAKASKGGCPHPSSVSLI